MNNSSITISLALFNRFSIATRKEIFQIIGISLEQLEGDSAAKGHSKNLDDNELPELSMSQIRKLTDGVGGKVFAVLKSIVSRGAVSNDGVSFSFTMKDLIESIEGAKRYNDLSGVWTVLTRRTRKILDDSDAFLIRWDTPDLDADGNYVDQVGHISLLTSESLKRFFSI